MEKKKKKSVDVDSSAAGKLCTMNTVDAILLTGLLLASASASTCQAPSSYTGTPFSYVQPLNTTILTPYGHSPAVYPSRKCILDRIRPFPFNRC